MSQQIQVGVNPNGILFGQQPACIISNVGPVTVYLGNDATVSPTTDYPLAPGSAIHYTDYAEVWSVTDANASTSGLVQVLYDADYLWQNFEVGRLLSTTPNNGTTTSSITVTGNANFQVSAYAVILRAAGSGFLMSAQWATGVYGVSFVEDTNGQTHQSYTRFNALPVGQGVTTNEILVASVFPNPSGRGGTVNVSLPSALNRGIFNIEIYAVQYPVTATQVYPTRIAVACSAATTLWTQVGNVWTSFGNSLAAASTTDFVLPPATGPVRIIVAGTQVGAGSLTAQVMLEGDTSGTVLTFDNLVSSTAAGSFFAGATYGVYPTVPTRVRFITAAGVTASSVGVTLVNGVV